MGRKGKAGSGLRKLKCWKDEVSALFTAPAGLQACSPLEGIGFAHNKNNSRHHFRPKSLPHPTYTRRLMNVTSLLDMTDYHPQFANGERFEKIIAKCKPFLIPKARNVNIYLKNQKGLV